MRTRLLILGGTYCSRLLAQKLAPRKDLDITLSLAGRTKNPAPQAVPTRTGGFGGVDGLARTLVDQHISILIDATHPFATGISANAVAAAAQTNIDFFALRRPPWQPIAGDNWQEVASVKDALLYAGEKPQRIFVALGRQELDPLLQAPQHHYMIRSVDPIEPPLDLPQVNYILDRGPFDKAREVELLHHKNISLIIAKNSGGPATYGKLEAARDLKIPVILIARPPLPKGTSVETVEEAVLKLDHLLSPAKKRGV